MVFLSAAVGDANQKARANDSAVSASKAPIWTSPLRPATPIDQLGGNDCASATNLSATIACDGQWRIEQPMGMTIALPSGGPAGACWAGGDGVQNDVWYRWTNTAPFAVEFVASTNNLRNAGPPLGDSQIAIYTNCAGIPQIGCSDDVSGTNLLSDTCFVNVNPGQSIVIQFDGFAGNTDFDAAFFMCRPVSTTLGGNCATAIDLGAVAPSMTPIASNGHYTCPTGVSDFNEIDPQTNNPLNQPETCFSFTPTANGWAQMAATPASNNSRIILSDDNGVSWTVSEQCWAVTPAPPDGIYGASAQHGQMVQAGTTYCACVDSHTAPNTFANATWDFELYVWPLTTQVNLDCATAQDVSFCGGVGNSVAFTNLSTAGATDDPGVPISNGCSPAFWDICSGFGADLNYSLTWTQGMVDCSCSGFRVTQTAPDLNPGVGNLVCDAALQIGTTCPITAGSCVATVDDGCPSGGGCGSTSEVAVVSGLGQADVGTVYSVQADQYMDSACPSFDLTFDLLNCTPGCAVCTAAIPDLDLTKTLTSAPVAATGATVTFDITIENLGTSALASGVIGDTIPPCLDPIGLDGQPCPTAGPSSVNCVGVGCATATCTISNGGRGFVFNGFNLAATNGVPGGPDELTLAVALIAGNIGGPCQNLAGASDPTDGTITSTAIVNIQATAAADLTLTKTRTSPATAAPGSTVSFDIDLENIGGTAHAGGIIGDTLPTCVESIGLDGQPCPLGPSAPAVTCAGAGCAGAVCTISNGGLGFVYNGFSLSASDAAPGGPDQVTISVDVTAGSTPGLCTNLAGTADPADGTVTDSADVTIVPGSGCSISTALETPPISRLPPPWVYTVACAPGMNRLDNTSSLGAVAPGGSVDTTDPSAPGTSGELTLYQLDCGCANVIRLTKNLGVVQVNAAP